MLLPLAPLLVFLALLSWRLRQRSGRAWRLGAIEAGTILAGGVVLGSELLSVFNLFRPAWISVAWMLGGVAAVFLLGSTWRQDSRTRHRVVVRLLRLPRRIRRAAGAWWCLLGLVVATGIIAGISPPTNFDSMTYQFPRVMHWLQQGNTDHFPTTNVRQLSYGTGAAYWQSQLWVLGDGDRAASLLQWLAGLGALSGLSLCLRRIVPRRARALALLTAFALPMTLLQASSSQTDLQVTAWCLAGLALLATNRSGGTLTMALAGLAFGLAVLTKPTAALVGTPFAIMMLWPRSGTGTSSRAIRQALIVGVTGLLICSPQILRNLHAFGTPLGPSGGTLMEKHSPAAWLGNGARWISLNVPSLTYWHATAGALEFMGLDVNDPATTFTGLDYAPAKPEVVYRLLLADEDFVPYTSVIVLVGLSLWIGRRHRPRGPKIWGWWMAGAVSLMAFAALVKWQCWGNRLLLPLAWLLLPVLMGRSGVSAVPWGQRLIVAAFTLNAAWLLAFSVNRPLVSLPDHWRFAGETLTPWESTRDERFYAGYNAAAAVDAHSAAALAAQYDWQALGLDVDWNYPEFVVWRAFHDAGLTDVQIHHVKSVEGKGLEPRAIRFDAVLAIEAADAGP